MNGYYSSYIRLAKHRGDRLREGTNFSSANVPGDQISCDSIYGITRLRRPTPSCHGIIYTSFYLVSGPQAAYVCSEEI